MKLTGIIVTVLAIIFLSFDSGIAADKVVVIPLTSSSKVAQIETRIAQLEALLAGVSRVSDSNAIRFSGVNVQIVSGSGETDGTVNGLGNLIIGYNERRSAGNVRTGSHNLVVGIEHNFSSYGGFVAGRFNTISGAYASVSGGTSNTANFESSSVSGGADNTASYDSSSISGGRYNNASGNYSSVSGGASNTADSSYSTVSGGQSRSVMGAYDWRAGSYFQDF